MVDNDKERMHVTIPKSLSKSVRDVAEETGLPISLVFSLAVSAGLSGKKLGEVLFDKVVKSDGK